MADDPRDTPTPTATGPALPARAEYAQVRGAPEGVTQRVVIPRGGERGLAPRGRERLALGIALAADVLQIVLVPALLPGFIANEVIDVIVAVVLWRLLGWHWVFLPTFAAEALPVVDLAPTWTLAVLFATRGRVRSVESNDPSTRIDSRG